MNLITRLLQFENQLRLPRQYLLFYTRTPNGWLDTGWEGGFGWDSDLSAWSIPRTVTDWTGTERDMFTILGEGLFFDAAGNSLVVSGTQILTWAGINQYHILYYPMRGLAVYDPATVTEATINKARKYMKDDRLIDDPEVLSLIPNTYPFIDSNGTERTLYPLQYIETVANLDLSNTSIVGTETVTAKQGTAMVTVAAGKLTVGAGTLWSWALSNGSTYEFGTTLTATTGICFDTSGNERHLTFTVTDTDAVCKGGREVGSDWLNFQGVDIADGRKFFDANGLVQIPDNLVIPCGADGESIAYIPEISSSSFVRPGTWVLLGDSIMQTNSDAFSDNGTAGTAQGRDWGFVNWTNVYLEQSMEILHNAAVGGVNSEYILATEVPITITKKAQYAMVLSGTNDLISSAKETILSNIIATYTALLASGIEKIICIPILPNGNITTQLIQDKFDYVKAGISAFCQSKPNQCIFADIGLAILDTNATYSTPLAGMLQDAAHPGISGAITLAKDLAPIIEASGFSPSERNITYTSPYNIVVNGGMAGTSGTKDGTVTGTVPTGWSANNAGAYSGFTSSVASIVVKEGKSWLQMVCAGGNELGNINLVPAKLTFKKGRKYRAWIDFEIDHWESLGDREGYINLVLTSGGGASTNYAFGLRHNTQLLIVNAEGKGKIQTNILNTPTDATYMTLSFHFAGSAFTVRISNAVCVEVLQEA